MTQEIWNSYGPTAARPQADTSTRPKLSCPVVDMHAHVFVQEAATIAGPHLDIANMPLVKYATDETRKLGGRQDKDRYGILAGHEERLADMEAMGVDIQVVTPSPAQVYLGLNQEVAESAFKALNDGMAKFSSVDPKRFISFGAVPMQHPDSALRELERCQEELGFKGIEIITNVNGEEVSSPQFEGFWQEVERRGMVVFLHPAGFTEGRRLSRYYFNNTIGVPLDTTVALHHLIFDGVLHRHPALKLLSSHGGGYAASYMARMDHAWGARSDAHGDLPNPPSSYLRRVYFDTVVFSANQLQHLKNEFGSDHILMGSDYPFDMGEYQPLDHVLETFGSDLQTIEQIVGGNAADLLNLDRKV